MPTPVQSDLDFSGSRILNLPSPIDLGQPLIYDGPPFRSGADLMIAQAQLAPTTVAQVANTIRAFPFRVNKTVTVTQLRVEVTTLLAAATFRLGLYSDNGQAYPGALLAGSDTIAFDASAVGVKPVQTFAPPIVLKPGLYWLAVNNSGTPTLRGVAVGAIDPVLGHNPIGGASSNYTGYSAALAFGALPATFPIGAGLLGNIAAPAAMFRVQ
jgi:hypothetical protein